MGRDQVDEDIIQKFVAVVERQPPIANEYSTLADALATWFRKPRTELHPADLAELEGLLAKRRALRATVAGIHEAAQKLLEAPAGDNRPAAAQKR